MELNFKEWLNEASRWKSTGWKRPPVDALERLKKYNRIGYYCHFTDWNNKIGINPQTQHLDYTPHGIYAYTVKYAIEHKIVNLPYANDKDYIWVFRARNPKKIKKIKDRRDEAGRLYLRGANESYSTSQMANWFLRSGVEGFVDEGTSTIHPSEPYQVVFFGSQTIIPVDVFKNTISQESLKTNLKKAISSVKEDDPYGDYSDDYQDDDDDFYDSAYDEPYQTAYGKSPWGKK